MGMRFATWIVRRLWGRFTGSSSKRIGKV